MKIYKFPKNSHMKPSGAKCPKSCLKLWSVGFLLWSLDVRHGAKPLSTVDSWRLPPPQRPEPGSDADVWCDFILVFFCKFRRQIHIEHFGVQVFLENLRERSIGSIRCFIFCQNAEWFFESNRVWKSCSSHPVYARKKTSSSCFFFFSFLLMFS